MTATATHTTLQGTRVLSLALNLPGPAALMRCQRLGAECVKLEPLPRHGVSADPMGAYNPEAYAVMHSGVRVVHADLKSAEGQALLHTELAQTDVLITSFRPSALRKLGLDWATLSARHPRLSLVEIVGAPGDRAEEPGHDLTYLAEAGLVPDLHLPATLFADMAGALQASEAVLQCLLERARSGVGARREIALSEAARWLALPRHWGLTRPEGAVGGAHAGYRVYRCRDGRVALAALEPHFAAALCQQAGIAITGPETLFSAATHDAVAQFLAGQTCAALDTLAQQHDVPLYTLAD
ncbi:CoA transferase [Curvibacter sp. HBC61]|uniref:CoA transferase n=1 Tax=Curvibacter cyanobacteriorum TaxID=3026422 RepID=A0ABT5MXB1_9BURK|nr:CoA transferase [Curvibacter sp. HBC61]MDD0838076.1 CoA transferase [Curvibacter sp. HBC61]